MASSSRRALVYVPDAVVERVRASPVFGADFTAKSWVYNASMKAARNAFTADNDGGEPQLSLEIHVDFDNPSSDFTSMLHLEPNIAHREYLMRFCNPGLQHHKRKLLHLAAATGDILLAYEMIRWGAKLHSVDAYGDTPLMTGVQLMRMWWWWAGRFRATVGSGLSAGKRAALRQAEETTATHIARISEVVRLFVRHHAAIDLPSRVGTPLRIACVIGDWDLIEMLLAHGADPRAALTRAEFDDGPLFRSDPKSLARFAALTSAVTKGEAFSRPPRLCPCASGDELEKCHTPGSSFPYPASLMCPCKSGKTYGKCCSSRVKWSETWDEEHQWLQASREVKYSFLDHPTPNFDVEAVLENIKAGAGPDVDPEELEETLEMVRFGESSKREFLLLKCQDLARQGRVDPAFAFAVQDLKALPPTREDSSKKHNRVKREDWNAAVDRYISLGQDKRPSREIEIAAKVDVNGAPMWKRCTLPSCARVEESPGAHRVCGGCKMACYCDADCQKIDWKAHKKTCKSCPAPQLLPSQAAVMEWYRSIVTPEVLRDAKAVYDDVRKTSVKGRALTEELVSRTMSMYNL